MANVKLRIEINPDANEESLGTVVTQNMEFANTSIQPNADGVFSNFPTISNAENGINALTFGQDLYFNDSDYLDNIDGFGAGLDDDEIKNEVVWGIVNEDRTYNVTLTFSNAQNLKNIIIYGDNQSKQYPTRAILDGTKEIFSDDYIWNIEFENASDTHKIEFTHWNRANYNAVLTVINVVLQYYDIDIYNGLKSVESLSQSSPNTTGIYYGSLESSGSAEMVDVNGELGDLLSDGVIDNSNVPVKILVNGKEVQHHVSTDSNYNRNSKTLSIELGNRLNTLDVLKYKGYNYPDHSENLANLLFDVLSNLRYALFGKDQQLKEQEFKQMLSARYDSTMSLYDYLYSIQVKYPFIEANKTYREIIDEFCLIAQMQMFIDDDNNVKFVSARPKHFGDNLQAICIPKTNMFSQLDYSVILRNKYDAVQIQKLKSSESYQSGVNVFKDDIEVSENLSDYETSQAKVYAKNYYYTLGSGVVSTAIILCDYYLKSGSVYINKKTDNNLTKTLTYDTLASTGRYTYSLTYKQRTGTARGTFNVTLNQSENVADSWSLQTLNESSLNETNKVFEGQFSNIEYDYTYSGVMGDITAVAKLPKPFTRESMVIRDETEDGFWLDYKVVVGRKLYQLGGKVFPTATQYSGQLIADGDVIEEYPIGLTLFLKGDQYSIVFENESLQSSNFENSKNSVSLSSNLVAIDNAFYDTIKNNILADYKQGVSNATISISCSDYFDTNGNKVINWLKGEILQVDQIIYFDNDLYKDQTQRYWKIKGRNFRKSGVPMIDLELEELVNKPLESFSWKEIDEISKSGLASGVFSVGDTKSFTLSTGETLIAQIVGFNNEEKSDGTGKAGITFVLENPTQNSYTRANVQNWLTSSMRNTILPTILNAMNKDLQGVIKQIKRGYVPAGFIDVEYYNDTLYLPTYDRVYGWDAYQYFQDTTKISKGVAWWLGNPQETYYVGADGSPNIALSTDTCKICFAFCI